MEFCISDSGSEGHLLEPPDQALITLAGGLQSSLVEDFAGPERACGDDPSTLRLKEAVICKHKWKYSVTRHSRQAVGFGGVLVRPRHQAVSFGGVSVRPSHQTVGFGGVSVRPRHQAVGFSVCPSQCSGEFLGEGRTKGGSGEAGTGSSVSALE
jgi:hypothetical protein